MAIKGSCFCGDVQYQIEGTLRDATSCHCSMCRKMFSSQASAHAFFEPDEFSWLMDESRLSHYQAGKKFGVCFCKRCGSTLGGTYKGTLCWVTLGCADGDPHISLGKHIFVDSKASWETIPDDVPQYAEWPSKNT
jgi:Uncharacterized conserved protein